MVIMILKQQARILKHKVRFSQRSIAFQSFFGNIFNRVMESAKNVTYCRDFTLNSNTMEINGVVLIVLTALIYCIKSAAEIIQEELFCHYINNNQQMLLRQIFLSVFFQLSTSSLVIDATLICKLIFRISSINLGVLVCHFCLHWKISTAEFRRKALSLYRCSSSCKLPYFLRC